MKKTLSAALAALLLSLAGPLLAADTWTIDTTHSEVGFKVRHFVAKTSGRFNKFDGTITVDPAKPEAAVVEFTIETASIDTKNEKRDGHLRSADFFDAEKNPKITFKSTKIKSTGKDRYDVTGDFTMRGVTKSITIPVAFLGSQKDPWGGERGGFETSLTLNRKDYGINWNKTLDQGGLMLSDEVDVYISLEVAKKGAEKPAAAAAK